MRSSSVGFRSLREWKSGRIGRKKRSKRVGGSVLGMCSVYDVSVRVKPFPTYRVIFFWYGSGSTDKNTQQSKNNCIAFIQCIGNFSWMYITFLPNLYYIDQSMCHAENVWEVYAGQCSPCGKELPDRTIPKRSGMVSVSIDGKVPISKSSKAEDPIALYVKNMKKSKFQIVCSSRSRVEGKEARGATQGTARHGNTLSACRGTEAIDL